MKVKVISTIYLDLEFFPPDVINSDTIGDYKAEIDAELQNQACDHIWNMDKPLEEIIINSVEPSEMDGIEEYGKLLDNWIREYPKKNKHEV